MVRILPHHLAATCHIELQENRNRQLQAQEHLRDQHAWNESVTNTINSNAGI